MRASPIKYQITDGGRPLAFSIPAGQEDNRPTANNPPRESILFGSARDKLVASLIASLAEFERDLLRETVRFGIAAAKKRRVVFGRRPGQRVEADRFAPKVLKLVNEG